MSNLATLKGGERRGQGHSGEFLFTEMKLKAAADV